MESNKEANENKEFSTAVNPQTSERLLGLLTSDDGLNAGEPKQLFCELEELNDGVWCEVARWVRFEEDVEIGGDRWSKPFVAAISLRALFDLRHCLTTGLVLLNVDVQSFRQLSALVAENLIAARQLNPDVRDRFAETLQLRHVHQYEHDGLKKAISEIGKKLSPKRNIEESVQVMEIKQQGGENKTCSSTLLPPQASSPSLVPQTTVRQNENFVKKLTPGSETSVSLIGGVGYLKSTVAAFVRLASTAAFHECSEVAIPTRFVFILMGPTQQAKELREIGRAMETLMCDDIFRGFAYRGTSRQDLLTGFDEFFNEGTFLPPSEWDPLLRIEPPKQIPSTKERKMNILGGKSVSVFSNAHSQSQLSPIPEISAAAEVNNHTAEGCSEVIDPELLRTGHVFGGLVADFRRKWHWLANGSDITDAFNTQCVASIFFLFFACLASNVTFGGLLGLATDNHMAAFEAILTGAVCGTTYYLFAGQPLNIIGATGPVLLFEKILFTFAKENDMNYLTLRFWIGIWTAVYLMVVVVFDLSALVQLITRFTEECFATLVSVIFIFEAFIALNGISEGNPFSSNSHDNVTRNYTSSSCNCDWMLSNYSLVFNKTDLPPCHITRPPTCDICPPLPDVFFFSVLISLGTCGLTFALKAFRTSPFFPTKVRAVVSDFAVSISIVLMVATDFFVALPTPKLTVPQEFAPTRPDREWLVRPFVNPVWTIFVASFPALLLAVLLFMDQQIPAVIVNRRENKLVKGKGYHLDLFVLTWQIVFCAAFGLPYYVAATVLAIAHVESLRKQSETSAPGEQPRFLGLIEQRVTGVMIFALIGCAIPLRGILGFIPMPVLYGVFLYMGLSALQTSQFFNRCLLILMPVKYQPDAPYLRHMKTWRVHLFTSIQLVAFFILWVIKETKEISILFILMLVVMVMLRKLLDRVFTQDELRWVDDILPKNPLAVADKQEVNNQQSSGTIAGNTGDQCLRRGAKETDTAVSLLPLTAADLQPTDSVL